MMSIDGLWNKRATDYWNMAIRYLRLIGNSGFLFTVYLAIIVGSYYYGELLKWLPESFPAHIFLAILTAVLVTKSRFRTFVKEGDLVFLTPVEGKLVKYFRSSFYYSFVKQSFVLIIVIVLLTPLYRHFIVDNVRSLMFVVIVLLISKGWNLLTQWEEGRLQFIEVRKLHQGGRFVVNLVLTYFLFTGAEIYFIIFVLLVMGALLIFYYQQFKKQNSLKWEYLVEVEERSVMLFYRMANMFTDVPKLSTKVKQRKFLSSIPNLVRFEQSTTFSYLYAKSFIRANDYFGIYVRLMLVGIILLLYVQFDFGRVFISLLFLYMSALQLSTLWKHHSLNVWIDLYPINVEVRKKSFSSIVFLLLSIKTVLFSVITLIWTGDIVEGVIVLSSGFIFSYFYSYFLVYRSIDIK